MKNARLHRPAFVRHEPGTAGAMGVREVGGAVGAERAGSDVSARRAMRAMSRVAAMSATGVLAVMGVLAPPALAALPAPQSPPPVDMGVPLEHKVDARVDAVVLYGGRAAVTRAATVPLDAGLHALRFPNLPPTVATDSVQARLGGGARLINVEFVETRKPDPTGSPEARAIAEAVTKARQGVEWLKQDRQQIATSAKLVEAIGVRVTGDASAAAGTSRLDLEALRKELAFVEAERARLVKADRELAEQIERATRDLQALEARATAMGAGDRVERSAVVLVAVPDAAEVPVQLTYLVEQAGWAPRYNVRTAADRSSVVVEFDAELTQRSGEDWNDVRVSLSTAQPTLAANPPTVSPVYVDVYRPPPPATAAPLPPSGGGGGGVVGAPAEQRAYKYGGAESKPEAEKRDQALGREMERISGAASVAGEGTAVSYELPRRVTVPTNSDRSTRTRVATIEPKATFVYSAQPAATEGVYLRGQLVNASPFQLIPGPAQIFMGSDYVGPTSIGSVAPGGEFRVYFGIDRAIRATRQLVSRTTSERGLFSSSTETLWEWRVTLDNGTGREVQVELFDRRPVSRDEAIKVDVEKLAPPLSTDAEYLKGPATQGILRWDLKVPAGATGAAAMPVSWTTRLTAPKGAPISPIPD